MIGWPGWLRWRPEAGAGECWAGRYHGGGGARIGLGLSGRPIVGDGVEQAGFAHAFALVINDDPRGGVFALEADLDGAVGQVARGFEAEGFEGEGVVGADVAFFLDEEQFVVGLVGRQEADAAAVEGEAVDRLHAEDGVELGVVVFLDPVRELAVEGFEAGEVELAAKELIADGAEKALDFSLGGGVADRRVGEEAADAGADVGDFLGGVDGAVVDVQRVRDAAFVEGGAEGLDQGVDVFLEEELAVAADAAGVIDEGDEPGLDWRAIELDVRAEHGVGLPQLVGVLWRKPGVACCPTRPRA